MLNFFLVLTPRFADVEAAQHALDFAIGKYDYEMNYSSQ